MTAQDAGGAGTIAHRPRSSRVRRERFRDRRQRAQVCRALLARIGLADVWTNDGPAIQSPADLRRALDRVQPGALSLLLLCWAVWDETGILAFSDVFRLDEEELGLVGDLLSSVSQGPEEIDRWIARCVAQPS
ncbi:MAG TPA: hypothetical protein VK714_14945 [Myxococcota bacterium]|nr:hypothetical protein [Myxococcota bacterium]